jgi:ribonuclease VapC
MSLYRSTAKRQSVSSVVLDASALLAVLRKERGAEVVERHLAGAALSAVNYSEVLKKAVEAGGVLDAAAAVIEGLQLDIIPFSERQAAVAAGLFAKTRDKGLSFADRACLALAIERKAVLYTADRRLAEIATGIRIVLIRREAGQAAKKK